MESYESRHDPGPPRNLAPPWVKSPLVILGSGNPVPNPYRFGPASAVVVNGKPYLFDAGEGVWRALAKAATFHGGAIARAFQVERPACSSPTCTRITHRESRRSFCSRGI